MTDSAEKLSDEQKELVSVGASVGAGCHPCVRHHIKAALTAGVDEQRLVAALTSSDRVAAEATKRMATHSRSVLGVEPTASAAADSSLDDALASFGAAVAANDKAAIEAQIAVARAAGATRSQLQEAIQAAATVQQNATRIHVREAERLVGQTAGETQEPSTTETDAHSATETDEESDTGGCDDFCPCHAAEEDEDAEAGCAEAPMAGVAGASSKRPSGDWPWAATSWPCDQRRI